MVIYISAGEETHDKKRKPLNSLILSCKGETPMTKNILVTDTNGEIIGSTYPKRARGLLKSGRAKEIDEFTIQLTGSRAAGAFSIDDSDEKTEDKEMANVIDFKARGFKLDDKITSGRGTRLIVTEFGENVECFEMADNGALTGIVKKVELETDQDYVFRFAIKSRFVHVDTAESSVSIFFDEEGDGYTYPIDRADKNRFKPVVCKKTGEDILRVYEMPFNSGDAKSCTISIKVRDITAWIYPAKDIESYAALNDIDYDQWRQDEIHNIAKRLNEIGGTIGGTLNDIGGTLGDTLNGIGEFAVGVGDKIGKAVNDAFGGNKSQDNAQKKADAAQEDETKEAKEIVINTVDEEKPAEDKAEEASESGTTEE